MQKHVNLVELSNEYLLAKFGFDTAENEPLKVCLIFTYFSSCPAQSSNFHIGTTPRPTTLAPRPRAGAEARDARGRDGSLRGRGGGEGGGRRPLVSRSVSDASRLPRFPHSLKVAAILPIPCKVRGR